MEKKLPASTAAKITPTELNVYDIIEGTHAHTERDKVKVTIPKKKSRSGKIEKDLASTSIKALMGDDLELQQKLNEREAKLQEHQVLDSLAITPSSLVTIGAGSSLPVSVTYRPMQLMKPFREVLSVQVAETILPISIVKGGTIGVQVFLSRQSIPFGMVMRGCSTENFVLLQNRGNVGTK